MYIYIYIYIYIIYTHKHIRPSSKHVWKNKLFCLYANFSCRTNLCIYNHVSIYEGISTSIHAFMSRISTYIESTRFSQTRDICISVLGYIHIYTFLPYILSLPSHRCTHKHDKCMSMHSDISTCTSLHAK
jgi:hypothetical protein